MNIRVRIELEGVPVWAVSLTHRLNNHANTSPMDALGLIANDLERMARTLRDVGREAVVLPPVGGISILQRISGVLRGRPPASSPEVHAAMADGDLGRRPWP